MSSHLPIPVEIHRFGCRRNSANKFARTLWCGTAFVVLFSVICREQGLTSLGLRSFLNLSVRRQSTCLEVHNLDVWGVNLVFEVELTELTRLRVDKKRVCMSLPW